MTTLTLRNADRLQHAAVSRLTVYTAGRVHALLYPFQAWLVGEVQDAADSDGNSDAAKLAQVLSAADPKWRAVVAEYADLLTRARRQAGVIAFGPWLVKHNHFFPDAVERLQEATFTPSGDDYTRLAEMWLRRRNYALNVAQQRVYGDGLNLSTRIWRLEQGGMQTIRNTIAQSMAQRTNAWDLARQLEGQLNADRNWPKWSEDRLRRMDARQRARSKEGLWRNAAEQEQGILQARLRIPRGISYNALRLARNEIQAANHAVTSDIAQNFPGIVGRKVVLSPAHPRLDQCDSAVAENPHPKTSNFLPLHPQCVTPGQLVQTRRGAIPIEAVQAGDFVLTHKGRYCLATAAWGTSHNDQVYEFETEAGKFELTGNHPVLLARGWVNAQDVQLGDHVLYATCGVLSDLASVVAEDMPALTGKPSITASVFDGGAFVPSNAVNFNGDSAGNESEVKEVTPDLVFPFVDQADGVQCVNHGEFCAGGVFEAHLPSAQQHGHQSGVVDLLGSGQLAAHVGALGDVDTIESVSLDGLAHSFTSRNAPAAIVLNPLVGDGFAVGAQRDTIGDQQLFETPVGDSVTLENLRGSEALNYVDLSQKVCDGQSGFSFDTQGLELCGADVVLGDMGTRPAFHLQATNGASKHDNLLLLSPDLQWGAGSGNPGVRGVANSSQAPTYYTTIRAIQRRPYTGTVYNMTVAGDNSYTVGGHVVHNCLCRWEEVLMPRADFTKQAGAWARGEGDFLDGYSSWLGWRSFAPVDTGAAGVAELWHMVDTWLDGDVDGMATVLDMTR